MKNFIFSDDGDSIGTRDSYKGVLRPGVSDVGELMDAVAEAMKFPKYFGENWNALSDCMRDFNWLEEKDVFIVHKELPNLEVDQLSIYVEILNDAVNDWKEGDEHELFVVFPAASEDKILSLM